jgi:hypothetical protein
MAPPAQPADRHEPLPGLFALPGHLLRQLSPGWRRFVIGTGIVLLVGAVVTAIVLGPRIAESNREHAAEQRRAERLSAAREQARLRAEQRPRTGTLAGGSFIAGVEQAITRDARARQATGELDTRVQRTDCHSIGHDGARTLLGCTAVTSEIPPSAGGTAKALAAASSATITRRAYSRYPYRGAVAPATGRYAICKTSGRPGEGSFIQRQKVTLPRACGG